MGANQSLRVDNFSPPLCSSVLVAKAPTWNVMNECMRDTHKY